jgi:hypothetical protein
MGVSEKKQSPRDRFGEEFDAIVRSKNAEIDGGKIFTWLVDYDEDEWDDEYAPTINILLTAFFDPNVKWDKNIAGRQNGGINFSMDDEVFFADADYDTQMIPERAFQWSLVISPEWVEGVATLTATEIIEDVLDSDNDWSDKAYDNFYKGVVDPLDEDNGETYGEIEDEF